MRHMNIVFIVVLRLSLERVFPNASTVFVTFCLRVKRLDFSPNASEVYPCSMSETIHSIRGCS